MDRKEQIQRAKELLECGVLSKETADAIKADFPELAESEDERIRRDIIALIEFALNDGSAVAPGSRTTKEEAIAYLEKQKDQKSAEWSEKDERHINTIIRAIHGAGNITPIDGELAEKWFKSLRPQPHWKPSEEQMCELNWASKLSPALESLYNDLKTKVI